MVRDSQDQDSFWAETRVSNPETDHALIVDVGGFEGPLDLLLSMAREQKVDLAKISVLELVDQYLAFINEARRLSLEIAADYLVMAAWLAYLKSRLLLPEPEDDDEPTGEELAQQLAFRLKRLEAMREAGQKILQMPQLGSETFARGMPEGIRSVTTPVYQDTLYDLLGAYARERTRTSITELKIARRAVMTIADARERLVQFIGGLAAWAPIDQFLLDYVVRPEERRSALASGFSAGLELVREGTLEMKQDGAFQPLMVRSREAAP